MTEKAKTGTTTSATKKASAASKRPGAASTGSSKAEVRIFHYVFDD